MRTLSALLDLVYPPKCPFCGRILERGEEGWCALCQEELPWTGGREGRAVEFCETCLSPLWYEAGAREGVRRLKFKGGALHARLLGGLMAQCLQDRWGQPVDLIVWAPLSRRSRKRRGYDQAELLARRVGELCGLSVAAALEKRRDTAVQSSLKQNAARRANVQGAYRALPGAELAGKRLVLVDDVVTSGATLSECAAALRVAGAESVVGLTLTRAR